MKNNMDPTPQMPGSSVKLTPEQRRHIENFESLPLAWRGKFNLVLTFLKEKKVSELLFDPNISETDVEVARKKIEGAGLFFADAGVKEDTVYKSGLKRHCFVGNNKSEADSFSKLWFGDHRLDPKVFRELGRMSGIPQTAIEVWAQTAHKDDATMRSLRAQLTLSENDRQYFPDERYVFSSFFVMSREHWQEEMEVGLKWARALKMADPLLYEEVMKTQLKLKYL